MILINKNITMRELFNRYFVYNGLRLIILTGNIGCGKSTFAKKIANYSKNFIIVNDDAITTMIDGCYTRYDERKRYFYKEIEHFCVDVGLRRGYNVIIDMPNVKRDSRCRFIPQGKQYAAQIISINFGPGNIVDLLRRIDNDRGCKNWEEVFKRKESQYIEPLLEEGFDLLIKIK